MNNKPLLTTDGQYLWIHQFGSVYGPITLADCPVNPKEAIGGKIHLVDNPLFLPADVLAKILRSEETI